MKGMMRIRVAAARLISLALSGAIVVALVLPVLNAAALIVA
jgi:hypothetical protein